MDDNMLMDSQSRKDSRPRRKHRNSRNGCPNCKKRRVKCSEDIPSCLNCVKHKVRCGYLDYTEDQLQVVRLSKFFSYPPQSNSFQFPIVQGQHNPPGYNPQYGQTEHIPLGSMYQPNFVTQDYTNLVPSSFPQPIVYPVYFIQEQGQPMNYVNTQQAYNMPQQPLREIQGEFFQMEPKMEPPSHVNDVLYSPLKKDPNVLPMGNYNPVSFRVLKKAKKNNKLLLVNSLREFIPKYRVGSYNLGQVRDIYILFLNSMLFESLSSTLFFSCLLNLTSNYLVSTSLNQKYMSPNISMVERNKSKSILLVKSVKHYAVTIKHLREGLISGSQPEAISNSSYLLSLMSIYDPEATLSSFRCFKEGLFSILQHYLTTKKSITSILIPIHLELMKNIMKSILYLSYDTSFLNEYLSFLSQFGNILSILINISAGRISILDHIEYNYKNLLSFTSELILKYIPQFKEAINTKNTEEQEEILFEMLLRWSRIVPSEVHTMNPKTNSLMRILCLFFKALGKSLFAILPQSKFFFLKDFESPIMLDTFDMENKEIFFQNLSLDIYRGGSDSNYDTDKMETELKIITGYLLRLINFFQKRTNRMYKYFVVDQQKPQAVPVFESIQDWTIKTLAQKENPVDIENAFETPIKSFSSTVIRPHHYPHRLGDEDGIARSPGDEGQFQESDLNMAVSKSSSISTNVTSPDSFHSLLSPDSGLNSSAAHLPSIASAAGGYVPAITVDYLDIDYESGLLKCDYDPENMATTPSLKLQKPSLDDFVEEEEEEEELENDELGLFDDNFNSIHLKQDV